MGLYNLNRIYFKFCWNRDYKKKICAADLFRTQSQLFFQTTHSSRPPLFTHKKKIWIINQFPSHLRTIFRKKITSFIDSSYFWTPWGEITTRKSHHYLVAKKNKDFWQGSSLFLSFSRTLNYLFLNLIKAILKK